MAEWEIHRFVASRVFGDSWHFVHESHESRFMIGAVVLTKESIHQVRDAVIPKIIADLLGVLGVRGWRCQLNIELSFAL